MTEWIGQVWGQYQLLEQAGKGGMSTVYRARQSSMNRDVALKILPQSLLHDGNFLERFYREVEVIAALQHPHILPVYDFGEYEGLPYIVMAYMSGGTLADVIAQGQMDTATVSQVVRQMADALDYAHSKGIIHRDFKPGNVLLDERGNTYLADFGLAKVTEGNANITGTGMLGTPTYMAPEQAQSNEITHSVDIYALGVTIYQMLAGRAPYDAQNPIAVLMAHVSQPIPDLRLVRPDLPDAVQGFIEKAMAKAMPDRYTTAGALASGLNYALQASSSLIQAITVESREALLMTNMAGQVIFVDQAALKMLKRHHNEARTIIGRTLSDVLGIPTTTANQLIADIAKAGRVDARRLEAHDATGTTFAVSCTAIATRDDKGAFVGADITLQQVMDIHIGSRPDDFDTAEQFLNTREETYLQTYFAAQMEQLWESLIQWGGKRLGANLENIVNETAQRNNWPVKMSNGSVNVELRSTDADIYRALMAKALVYGVSLVGKKVIVKSVQSADKKMDANVLSLVSELRINELFDEIL